MILIMNMMLMILMTIDDDNNIIRELKERGQQRQRERYKTIGVMYFLQFGSCLYRPLKQQIIGIVGARLELFLSFPLLQCISL